MKRMNTKWIIGLVMVTIALSGFSCAHENAEKKDVTVSRVEHENIMSQYRKGVEESKKMVVARVNGADITLDKLLSRMNQIAPAYVGHGQRTPETDEQVKHGALSILIFRELAVQEAIRRGMKVPTEQVDEALKKIKADIGSEDVFKKTLTTAGETEESFRKYLERNMLFDMITAEEIFHKAKGKGADDEEIEQRKQEWEAELRKNAKIEILLPEVEKKLRGAQNPSR